MHGMRSDTVATIQLPRHRLHGHADPSSNTGRVEPCEVGAFKELPLVNHPARRGQPFQVSCWSALRAGVLRRAVSSLGSPQAPSWPSDTVQRCALLGHGCSGSLGAFKNRGLPQWQCRQSVQWLVSTSPVLRSGGLTLRSTGEPTAGRATVQGDCHFRAAVRCLPVTSNVRLHEDAAALSQQSACCALSCL